MGTYNYTTILVDLKKSWATMWLNRPQSHNAINPLLMNEVIHFFNEIENNPSIKIIVIRGIGKSLCAGADLAWMHKSALLNEKENIEECELLSRFFSTIYNSSKITIAVAHGNIFGGGNGLVAACDFAYALNNAIFSLSETRLGLIAATITPYMLNRLPVAVYKELIFTARKFYGEDAFAFGLVNKSFENEKDLDDYLSQTLMDIDNAGPRSLIGSKVLINSLLDADQTVAVKKEIPNILATTRIGLEAKEGFAAFLEKRKPNW